MQTSELISEVKRIGANILVPTLYNDTTILGFLNRGRTAIAGGGDRQHGNALLPPLPDLLTSTTVTAIAASVSMPSTFQRGLLRVTDSSGNKLKKYDSLVKMLDAYSGATGTPEAYCLKGRMLWVAPTPTSAVLTVLFHKYPVALVNATDVPTELPEHLHWRLLVNFALLEIANEIEEGTLGANVDSAKHEIMYQKALTDLERHLGPAEGESQNVEDGYLTDDNLY